MTAAVTASTAGGMYRHERRRQGGGRGGSEVGGRAHSLATLVNWPLTTHPFGDGAPFLLLIDTSAIWALVTSLSYITLGAYRSELRRQGGGWGGGVGGGGARRVANGCRHGRREKCKTYKE